MAYDNLAGIFHGKQDGGAQIVESSGADTILVLGTATSGDTEQIYQVLDTNEAIAAFGSSSILIRGMHEVRSTGGENVRLFRIGATAAELDGIGDDDATGGVKIVTAAKDDSAGTDYEFYWDNTSTSQRLVVRDADSAVTVYDRDWSDDAPSTDLQEVYVTGDPTDGEGVDIGSPSSFVTLAGAGAGAYDVTYTAGTDGTDGSRMEMYEALFKAYELLENEDFDLVYPTDVYLDDLNVMDMSASTVASLGLTSLSDYPSQGATDDVLGKVYTEMYNGKRYFWWWFPADPDSPSFTSAQIYPSVGSAAGNKKIDGTALVAGDFHEVNFAYQLANFCYDISRNSNECLGYIGVNPPDSFGLQDVKNWIGTLPTYTLQTDGTYAVDSASDNGTGLLGNKFMAGKAGFRSGIQGGGFIATDDGFLDGTEETDLGGHKIDIGAYITVTGAWATTFNGFDTTGRGYTTNVAGMYCGAVSTRVSKSGMTNKVLPNARLPFRISNANLDRLAGVKYTMLMDKVKGTVVADAPTAACSDSDFQRQTTMRIVKDVVDAARSAADPFLGEALTDLGLTALQNAVDNALGKLQKGKFISRRNVQVTATRAQRVAGEVTLKINIVPAWEVRQINLILSLKPA